MEFTHFSPVLQYYRLQPCVNIQLEAEVFNPLDIFPLIPIVNKSCRSASINLPMGPKFAKVFNPLISLILNHFQL